MTLLVLYLITFLYALFLLFRVLLYLRIPKCLSRTYLQGMKFDLVDLSSWRRYLEPYFLHQFHREHLLRIQEEYLQLLFLRVKNSIVYYQDKYQILDQNA